MQYYNWIGNLIMVTICGIIITAIVSYLFDDVWSDKKDKRLDKKDDWDL